MKIKNVHLAPGYSAFYFDDQAAIKALHGMSVDGRSIVVNLARPREERSDAGGYTASKRSDVGYGTGGYGGGRY